MAREKKKVVDRVMQILDQASDFIGKWEAEKFSQWQYAEVIESEMDSPLEQALFIALHTVAPLNFLEFAHPISKDQWAPGLIIRPQSKIGPYRADFVVEFMKWFDDGVKTFRQVVVECDGTAFHERTEVERRHEKQRDRYMQKLGLKVFRYTGKEILDDPYKIAAEVIGYVTDDEENTVTPGQYFASGE